MAKAAVGQICSTNSMAHNLEQCVKLVGKAAAAGAKILFLPEASDYVASSGQESLSLAQPMTTSPFVTGLQEAAAKHSLAVHVGIHEPVTVKPAITTNPVLPTIPTSSEPTPTETTTTTTATKLFNRTIYIDPTGTIPPSGIYDKLHLFDYGALRESRTTQAGSGFTPPFASPVGRLGSLICFDLRFAEAALHLAQPPLSPSPSPSPSAPAHAPAQILLYPSAFTVPTGRAHWDVLLRARAIETQSWVVAAAQVGRHHRGETGAATASNRVSYGRSLVVDPWGRVVLALRGVRDDGLEAEDGAVGELGLVDIDLGEWERVRERMPLVRRT
ncbi:carbon-nitrogen family protein [Xylariaceae sp. FL0662B]|nr:carbon-nitrogen family protein [Xylariaceae sp. FL0662B]